MCVRFNGGRFDTLVSHSILESLAGVPPGPVDHTRKVSQQFIDEMVAFCAFLEASGNNRVGFIVPTLALKLSLTRNYYVPGDSVGVIDMMSLVDVRVRHERRCDASLHAPGGVIGIVYAPGEMTGQHIVVLKTVVSAIVRTLGKRVSGRWLRSSLAH